MDDLRGKMKKGAESQRGRSQLRRRQCVLQLSRLFWEWSNIEAVRTRVDSSPNNKLAMKMRMKRGLKSCARESLETLRKKSNNDVLWLRESGRFRVGFRKEVQAQDLRISTD